MTIVGTKRLLLPRGVGRSPPRRGCPEPTERRACRRRVLDLLRRHLTVRRSVQVPDHESVVLVLRDGRHQQPTVASVVRLRPLLPCGQWLTFTVLCFFACDNEPDVAEGRVAVGPTVISVDSVLLDEKDRFYLGNPFSIVVDTTDGSFLISDFFESRILHYDRNGGLRGTYGRPGSGPGEFRSISTAFIVHDSIVVGADERRDLLQFFAKEDARFLGAVRFKGRAGLGGVPVIGDDVVFATRNLEDQTIAAVWRYPRQQVDHIVPLPDPYKRSIAGSGAFASFQSFGSVVAWQDTLLVGMSGTNELYLSTLDGIPYDTLRPPSRRRRGVPPDLQEQLDSPDIGTQSAMFEAASSMQGLYRLSGGRTLVLHHDSRLEGQLPTGSVTATVYVSVIAADRRSVCADGSVRFDNEMRTVHTVARDTLFLLDRSLNSEEDDLVTWVRFYEINTSDCTWLGMG